MKKQIPLATLLVALPLAVRAIGPIPDYQWNFNMTNSTPETNSILPTTAAGVTGFPATSEGVLSMLSFAGSPVNLLGLPGSGVSGGSEPLSPYDRAITLTGTMGGNGPIAVTPDASRTIAVGLITNFTITAWVKPDSAISGFPRIFMLAGQNVDAASSSFNSLGLLFFTGNNLQLKVHNLGNDGVSTTTGPLAAAQTNWAFVAVTYDSTVDPLATNNVHFYVGDRVNSLGEGLGFSYALTSVNSVDPAHPNGPGYINFAGNAFLNGDLTPGLTNAWVSIGNRPNRGRSFNGRYDDVRFYVNQVLDEAALESVRQDAYPFQPQPLQVTQSPQDTTVIEGQGAAFTVEHSEAPNASYQWYRINAGGGASNLIVGATSKDYVTPPLTVAADSGAQYAVRITSTDPVAGTTYSTYGTVTVVPAAQLAETPGMLTFEYFANAPGTSVDNFLASPPANYPHAPNLTHYLPTFDSRHAFPDDSHLNYFARITGWLTPTETTNYVFFIRGGDQAQLHLGTDDTTNNLALVASDTQNGPQVFYGAESIFAGADMPMSSAIPLVAGNRYAVVAYLKAGTTVDFVQVAWKPDSGFNDQPVSNADLGDRQQPISAATLSTVAVPNGTISLTQDPAGTSVPANSKVMLTVGVTFTGPGPLVVQWQKDGVNIPGATGLSYTTPYLTATASYRAVASVPGVSSNSTAATVTVTADNVLPTVVSAKSDDSMHAVTVQFSEPVDAATALNTANYSIPGLTVLGAAFSPDTNVVSNPPYDTVKLATSTQADNTAYTLTVTGVKDTANNTISGGNTAGFTSFGFATGFARFEYFENQTYQTAIFLSDVTSFVTYSSKFLNDDPDTIVYRSTAEMSPDGTPTIRSSSGGNLYAFPPFYGTRLSTYFIPPVTTNYVFYIAANASGLLWLSTDDNPANKRVIAYQDIAAGKWTWTGQTPNNSSATFPTNYVGSVVTVPNATPWPVADESGYAVISLTAGQRYYLELDHFENADFASYSAVTYVMAADNLTVTPPGNGTAPALTGDVIGWHFPLPEINSITQAGNDATIVWTGTEGLDTGYLGYPGLGDITASAYTTPVLQSAPAVAGPYSTLSTTSPTTKPATNAAEFFRVGPQ